MLGSDQPSPRSSGSPGFRQVYDAERAFSQTVRAFISAYPEQSRPFVQVVCRSWCKAWLSTHPSLEPALGAGVQELESEVYRSRWRSWYNEPSHREKILERRRRRYHQRKKKENSDA